ncbi:MAG: hypothetical protein MJZ66_01835 [Bacteroidales bacterium]|nr:hypothetical protein [Bacteroidales bacterium]
MNTALFATIMILIVFGFIAAMIWAYRKNDYKEEKEEVKQETLNSLDDTLKTITVYSDIRQKELEEEEKRKIEEEEARKKAEAESDPLAKIDLLQSRKSVIQNKNHIKKSAADEYFEKTKNVSNEILQPKTK